MTFWDLKCFVYAAKEQSFTSAAKKLFISQQALSARISHLESFYQTKLFERTTPLTLTVTGRYLFDQAQQILRFQDSVDSGMKSLTTRQGELLSIGTMLNRGTVILQKTVQIFLRKHPEMTMRVFEINDHDLSLALKNQPLDMLLCYQLQSRDVSFIPIYEEQYYLCISKELLTSLYNPEEQARLLSASTADIADYIRCPFLASSYTSFLTEDFKNCCQEAGIIPQVFMETSSVLTRLSLCISGLGIMFLSKSLKEQAATLFRPDMLSRLYMIPLAYQPYIAYHSLGFNYLRDKGLSPLGESFVRLAQSLLSDNI